MNYRHAFHAGNFADVLKHAVLARIVRYLRQKEGAFRVIDTHAGPGAYDLAGEQAQKTGEWRGGIGRVADAPLPKQAAELLEPYLSVVRGLNPQGRIATYPGSPLLVRRLLRPRDRLTAIELHPEDAEELRKLFADDFQTRVIHLDGWLALGAQVPPKEKRGLVLVDPPFEQAEDWDRLLAGLLQARKRWPGGTYALWYPIKDRAAVARFRQQLAQAQIAKILDISLEVGMAPGETRLAGCGMAVINPPYTLEAEMRTLLPVLCGLLATGSSASYRLEWLAGEVA